MLSRKIKSTGYIYLHGYKYNEDEGHLSMRSCLQDSFINSATSIGKYINKLESYNNFPPRRAKDTNMREIQNTLCVRSVMKVTPLFKIERVPLGASSIQIKVIYGL